MVTDHTYCPHTTESHSVLRKALQIPAIYIFAKSRSHLTLYVIQNNINNRVLRELSLDAKANV